mgnify:CR=1 FL=1
MATTTHRGITYSPFLTDDSASTGVLTVNIDMQLQGGVDQDDALWLTGGAAAGTAPHYPGNLDAFAARQSDGSNTGNPRLISLSLTTQGNFTDLSYITLASAATEGAQISKILSCQATGQNSEAIVSCTVPTDLKILMQTKQHSDSAAFQCKFDLLLLVV